jgi:hypothetical protein
MVLLVTTTVRLIFRPPLAAVVQYVSEYQAPAHIPSSNAVKDVPDRSAQVMASYRSQLNYATQVTMRKCLWSGELITISISLVLLYCMTSCLINPISSTVYDVK